MTKNDIITFGNYEWRVLDVSKGREKATSMFAGMADQRAVCGLRCG